MSITLAQAKAGMTNKIDQAVVDEFRRASFMLDSLTFDDAVSPGTGGSTLTYGYVQLLTPATAAFRAINSEYSAKEAVRTTKTVDLKIFGGKFGIDRVIQNTSGVVNEMSFQLEQMIKGATNLFHYTVINGDKSVSSDEFDGLDVMLTGASTEANSAGSAINLSNSSAVDANYKEFMDTIDIWLAGLDGRPSILAGNGTLISKIKSVARRAGYYTQTEDAFGRKVDAYDGIPLLDLGYYWNGTATAPCVANYQATIGTETVTGMTDLYAVSLGLDGFHAVSPLGGSPINAYLPDLSQPGVVKSGEVEMVAAVVLKSSRKAGVLRRIKVA